MWWFTPIISVTHEAKTNALKFMATWQFSETLFQNKNIKKAEDAAQWSLGSIPNTKIINEYINKKGKRTRLRNSLEDPIKRWLHRYGEKNLGRNNTLKTVLHHDSSSPLPSPLSCPTHLFKTGNHTEPKYNSLSEKVYESYKVRSLQAVSIFTYSMIYFIWRT